MLQTTTTPIPAISDFVKIGFNPEKYGKKIKSALQICLRLV